MQKSFNLLQKVIICLAAVLLATTFISVSCVFKGDNPPLAFADEQPSVNGKAAYLCDYCSGTVVYAKNENERLPIASMVKIMTSLLIFEAVDRGDLSLDEDVTVSPAAASMGGSQVFLDAGSKHKAGELLKSIIVASANDSCVALAERVSGSVGGFVADMNEKAASLGMTNTNYVNCTGLPAAESFSSAKDVSVVFRALLNHKKYFEYAAIWLEDFVHPSGRTTTITNTNKLIRFYNGCDGGKTGFTNEAKFCLAATAERNGTRLISVVIGSDSSKERFATVSGMFDYAFANYSNEVLVSSNDTIRDIGVTGGKYDTIGVKTASDVTVFKKRGDGGEYAVSYEIAENVKAPLKADSEVGKAYLTKNGEVIAEYAVYPVSDVERASYGDIIRKITGQW